MINAIMLAKKNITLHVRYILSELGAETQTIYVEHERRMSPEKMYVPEIYNCGGVKGLEKRVYEVFIHGMNLHGNY